MSELETMGATIIGTLMGYTKRWNPFANEIFARVQVDDSIINIPIDYRQIRIIQKEYPIDSLVRLVFNNGKWEITSKMAAAEHKLFNDSTTVFL